MFFETHEDFVAAVLYQADLSAQEEAEQEMRFFEGLFNAAATAWPDYVKTIH